MDNEPVAQMDFLSALGGINLDEIGGDEYWQIRYS